MSIKEADFLKFKDEIRQELKVFRESLERDLRNEIRDLKAEQRNLVQSLDFAHGSIDELKKKLESEVLKKECLATEKEALRKKCLAAESKIQDLEDRIVSSVQYSRRANIEIQGVIQKENESVTDLLVRIGNAVKEPIAESDIEACHRVPTRKADKTKSIVVQFKTRSKRDAVLKKAKKARLTNDDLGLDDTAPVFVNEHLCPALKKLLAMTVKKKHEHKWKSVWAYSGKIYAKQSDGSSAVLIAHESDLEGIFGQSE